MTLTLNPAISVLIMAVALGVAWLLSRLRTFHTVVEANSARLAPLDGLRGFLATGVFIHHIVIFPRYQRAGIWVPPSSHFYALLGQVPVILFFMVTGFLFWDKAIAADGQLNAVRLYRNRVRRVVPLYALLTVLVFAVSAWESPPHLVVSLPAFAKEVVRDLSMGIYRMRSLNGTPVGEIGASPTWTLSYEWKFYALLPLIAGLAIRRLRSGWLLLAPAALFITNDLCFVFVFGMISAHLKRSTALREILCSRFGSIGVVTALSLIWLVPDTGYDVLTYVLCFGVFLPIACGNRLGGILTHVSARHLGTISYSVYLLHCLFLYSVYRTFRLGPTLANLSPWAFCGAMAGLTGLLVTLCTVTYKYIEKPFMSSELARNPPVKPVPATVSIETDGATAPETVILAAPSNQSSIRQDPGVPLTRD